LLAARFGGLQAKMDQLLVQPEDEKFHRTNLQALNEKLETKIDFFLNFPFPIYYYLKRKEKENQ